MKESPLAKNITQHGRVQAIASPRDQSNASPTFAHIIDEEGGLNSTFQGSQTSGLMM
jgi:hypothetical protein